MKRSRSMSAQMGLPPGWDVAYDAKVKDNFQLENSPKFQGRMYFIDHNTKATTYKDPRHPVGSMDSPKSPKPAMKEMKEITEIK
jgi:hypothetical protein